MEQQVAVQKSNTNKKLKTMKTKFFIPLILLATVITVTSCNKKKEETTPQPTSTPLSYTSLSAEQTTISYTQNTKVTATATGEGLTYTWTLTGTGNLIGSGYQITYQPCCSGQQSITCVVKDSGANQASKSVTITVQ
jgi:hypothetical protein